jgi:sugar/nucleoside kinase (ribokinase family)
MTKRARNIFIIGDLVVDHTVFVKEADRPHHAGVVHEVVRRLDTAGGAAHVARILAVLNAGNTFLWGLTGESNWGDFRAILEHCQSLDCADANIKFRGAQDETHAQMNTVTRIIRPENIPAYGPPAAAMRFDDFGHVHISDDKRASVLYYLRRTHEKHTLDAIVLSDLDMNCLKPDLVRKIAEFADEKKIPLFVNTKALWADNRERDKYDHIEGTAIITNLPEWCHLVGQSSKFEDWRWRLKHEKGFEEMAQRSFQYFRNFVFHIIEGGEAGAVLMAPHPTMQDRYAVYLCKPHETLRKNPKSQLGCGEIMAAVFAMEMAGTGRVTEEATEEALRAFVRANAALACYRDMPWQRMPAWEVVDAEAGRMAEPEMKATPSKAMLFLPKDRNIRLSDPAIATRVPGIFSVDAVFRKTLDDLVRDIELGLKTGDPKSIILGAPSGTGKTEIVASLAKESEDRLGVRIILIKEKAKIDWDWNDPDAYFEKLLEERGAKAYRLLIALDEAAKDWISEYLKRQGMRLIDSAHAHNVRFMFMDADFTPGLFTPNLKDSGNTEYRSRCDPYFLPGLSQRLMDIPYIAAGMVFRLGTIRGHVFHTVNMEGTLLLALIGMTLSQPQLRALRGWVGNAYDAAAAEWDGKDTFTLRLDHLPKDQRPQNTPAGDIVRGFYEFYAAP